MKTYRFGLLKRMYGNRRMQYMLYFPTKYVQILCMWHLKAKIKLAFMVSFVCFEESCKSIIIADWLDEKSSETSWLHLSNAEIDRRLIYTTVVQPPVASNVLLSVHN
jgi:hypothetical protein